MTNEPSSPFSGLDKALLRSTQAAQDHESKPPTALDEPRKESSSRDTPKTDRSAVPEELDSQAVSSQANIIDSKHASMLAINDDKLIETIRKAVKAPGKEVLFVRLTMNEKRKIADIVYTYKCQGKRTSENEINRIAVNYILEDYRIHGENSIVAKVIDALLA